MSNFISAPYPHLHDEKWEQPIVNLENVFSIEKSLDWSVEPNVPTLKFNSISGYSECWFFKNEEDRERVFREILFPKFITVDPAIMGRIVKRTEGEIE